MTMDNTVKRTDQPFKRETRNAFFFPYEPYPIQLELMNLCFQIIDERKIGILESPTGTGKSLSVLCSSLSWLRNRHERKEIAKYEISDSDPDWLEAQAAQNTELTRSEEEKFTQSIECYRNTPIETLLVKSKAFDDVGSSQHSINRSKKRKRELKRNTIESQSELFLECGRILQTRFPGISSDPCTLLEDEYTQDIRIIFTSRTISQLSQVVREIKSIRMPLKVSRQDVICNKYSVNQKTLKNFEPIRAVQISSRSQMCINKEVSKLRPLSKLNRTCIELVNGTVSRCPFKNKNEDRKESIFTKKLLSSACDIEDLIKTGIDLASCPYYSTHAASQKAEIIILPYQLLLDKHSRKTLQVDLSNSIVVIDEAHNLQKTLEDMHSVFVNESQLDKFHILLQTYLKDAGSRISGERAGSIQMIDKFASKLLEYLNKKRNELRECRIDEEQVTEIDGQHFLLDRGMDQVNFIEISKFLSESSFCARLEKLASDTDIEFLDPGTTLETVIRSIQNLITSLTNPEYEGALISRISSKQALIQYILLDPSAAFRDVAELCRSLLLIGGTLSPMDGLAKILFPGSSKKIETFSCDHIIGESQLRFFCVSTGPQGEELNFTFKKRRSSDMIYSLGGAIISCLRRVPDGCVVFFPSYEYLNEVVKIWDKYGILQELNDIKPIFIEEKGSTSTVDHILESYHECIMHRKGATILSVIGGKLSEGINFSDRLGRCIILVGIPFPNPSDPEWNLRIRFAEKQFGEGSGKSLLENNAMRAVNQSIGRAIRHRDDYAVILAMDKRYGMTRIQELLPKWVRRNIASNNLSFSEMTRALETFFSCPERGVDPQSISETIYCTQ